ncbi:MAG: polymerase beta domain protein region protein [Candidatus Kuenenbacteria bacterium GW2011_GWA2_42_15]|uniref:Polymerase beta domain protein region protein n=1 Tax=Candidatus Kuenenbacteria bacterium GW2011_GWA2_42_15 TaxID=1618677 RepID=A0A0G0YSD0_9BACT|nr:MAG: polymerase beta domain protein region protein [Candidatus Kuenenbacteria bacterium GW2011_GWA2_42_15]
MDKFEIKENIRESLKKNPYLDKIKKVSLFGSYLHGAAKDDSDVDLLVEFSDGVSFFDLLDIEHSIGKDLGKKVDLVTPDALSKYFRTDILQQAEKIYERR